MDSHVSRERWLGLTCLMRERFFVLVQVILFGYPVRV